MATTKSMKIQAEIDKVKAKISEQQAWQPQAVLSFWLRWCCRDVSPHLRALPPCSCEW